MNAHPLIFRPHNAVHVGIVNESLDLQLGAGHRGTKTGRKRTAHLAERGLFQRDDRNGIALVREWRTHSQMEIRAGLYGKAGLLAGVFMPG